MTKAITRLFAALHTGFISEKAPSRLIRRSAKGYYIDPERIRRRTWAKIASRGTGG